MSRSVSSLPQKGNCDRSALDSRTPSQGTNKILGEILRNQRVILATLAEHGEILHNLQISYKDAEKNAQPEGWPARMPLSCLQELDEWESFLKHEDNHSFAVNYFSRFGGDSCSEMCRRILRKLFSVGLSGKLNILGSEKKKGLRSTATLKVIQGACCKYFPDIAHANVDKETVYAIGKWLRNQCPKK
ncbi:uncharacterized protein LOC124171820 [Ischnura elegans]|uniref:uncharacterized protein LOC124171820 n=1 Tax=Ischnura elegans TaxID=197161 RepID=UPI001ED8847A|nr:uncharacterized protein LOC124171820 [Ischnura elegans]